MPELALHVTRRINTSQVPGARESLRLAEAVVAFAYREGRHDVVTLDAASTVRRRSLHDPHVQTATLTALRGPAAGLATAADLVFVWGGSHLAALDAETLTEVATLAEPLGTISDAASLGGSLLAVVVAGGRALRVYDLDARECVASYGHAASSTYRVAAHPASGLVAVAGYEGDLTLYDHGARRAVARMKVSVRAPRGLRLLDDQTLAWIDHDEVLIIAYADGALRVQMREPLKALDVSRVDDALLIAHHEGVVAVTRGGERRAWHFANGSVRLACVTPEDAPSAMTVDTDGVIQRWRFEDAASEANSAGSRLERIFWSEALECAIAWGASVVMRWRRGTGAPERLDIAPTRDAIMSPDGRRLLLLRDEPAQASCVDLDTLAERALPASGHAAAVSPDGAQALFCDRNSFARVDLDAATRGVFAPPFPRFRTFFSERGDAVYLCDDGGAIARCALDGSVMARGDLACRWGYGDQLTGTSTGICGLWSAPDGALVVNVGHPITLPGTRDNWDGIYLRTDHSLRLLDAATFSTRATLCAVTATATLIARPQRDGYALLDAGCLSWVRGTDFGAPRSDLARGVSVARCASSPDGVWLAFVNADGAHRARAFEGQVASWRPAVPLRDAAVSARGEVFALDAWGAILELGGAT